MMEYRVRTKISQAELAQKKGRILTDSDYNILLTRAAFVFKPNGKPLACYIAGGTLDEMEVALPTLRSIRGKSDNRGLASGTKRINAGGSRTRAMPIMSSIMGAMDPAPNRNYCRLTAYTREHVDKWEGTFPLLRKVASLFELHVPDRFRAQQEEAKGTNQDWIVPGTPFTTITVNNSYSTGVHTDSGDLDKGFSCLTVGRLGSYSGGHLCFPEYRIAVNMNHGDLLLMDAHEWHGNTRMICECGNTMSEGPCTLCGAERLSVVCYYRTEMGKCGTRTQEDAKRSAWAEKRVTADA